MECANKYVHKGSFFRVRDIALTTALANDSILVDHLRERAPGQQKADMGEAGMCIIVLAAAS
jgi:hypothetical protein